MVLWIGVDDTDSLTGMCTTFLATEIIRDLTEDFDLIGYPRLVRLNPNIPWKTRGNGAVCIRVGKGRGVPAVVGSIAGRRVRSFSKGATPPDRATVVDRVARLVERWACFEDPNTNPAFAVLERPPNASLYWRAVRGVVPKRLALASSRGLGTVRRYKNGRGMIGALAAIAWRPRDRTYEILAYRRSEAWGTARTIVPESVIRLDQDFPSTFNNYDDANHRAVIAPRSPCPVLLGIRGDEPAVLPAAMDSIRGERPERWLVFETNQGTDDHVTSGGALRPWTTHRVSGAVSAAPRNVAGGHVIFRVGKVDVAAYEPSKQFRSVVRQLASGDRVCVIGAIRPRPRALNLEKIFVESTAAGFRKLSNPWCEQCHKHAKSSGRGNGFRCPRCKKRFPESAAIFVPLIRDLGPGWYEPPVGSRRHLAMPIKRMASRVKHGHLPALVGSVPSFIPVPPAALGSRGPESDTVARPFQ